MRPGRGCHQPEEGEEDGEEKVVLGHPLVGGGDRGEEVRGVYNPGIHGHRGSGRCLNVSDESSAT